MGRMAGNYARALLRLSVSHEDILASQRIWEQSEVLQKALCSPVVRDDEKGRVVQRIFPHAIQPFLLAVCKYHRWSILSEIFEAYRAVYGQTHGIVYGVLYYVDKPETEQLAAIERKLCERLSVQRVQLTLCRKEELIGGFQIHIAGLEIDESILGRLKLLEQTLIRR